MSRIEALVVLHPVSARAAAGRPVSECLHPLPAEAPALRVEDRGVSRGDGVFESLTAYDADPVDLPAHLQRLARSADRLELPEISGAVVEAGVRRALETAGAGETTVRIVVTRGPEGASEPTAWVTAAPAADLSDQRRDGVRVVLLDRGMRSDAGREAPWLLTGVKTLSYAIHAAAAREARRRGADDAVFVSTDGFVLEATTASVLVRRGRRMITPPQEHGILQGTTVTRAAAVLSELGMPLESRALPAAELSDCDALWLLSSGRRAVPVIELDGRPVPLDREVTAALERGLGRPQD